MVVPREHGAWGMLLVPLATGAVAASHIGVSATALTLFVVAAMSMFWLRTPLESWLGTSPIKARTEHERSVVLWTIIGIGMLAVSSIAALLWTGCRGLIIVGAISALAFAVQAGVKKLDAAAGCPRRSSARSD